MKNIEKYQSSAATTGEVDALLLTSEHNRHVCRGILRGRGRCRRLPRRGRYYFTDSRYIEAAQKNLHGLHCL